jgi:hypothetical protein
MEDVKWHRNEINQHKMFRGFQCDCCGGGKNGLRRRRRAPKYLLRALAQGKKVHHYPLHTVQPHDDDEEVEIPIYGLSSWKKTMKKDIIDKGGATDFQTPQYEIRQGH